MNTELTQQMPPQRLWSTLQVALGGYFGGPIAGFYLLGRNYTAFGQSRQARICYYTGPIIAIVLAMSVALLGLDTWATLAWISIAILSWVSVVLVAYRRQKKLIKQSLSEGGKRYSYWWWFLLMLCIGIVTQPLLLLLTLVLSYFT
jgi:hypothetical protein